VPLDLLGLLRLLLHGGLRLLHGLRALVTLLVADLSLLLQLLFLTLSDLEHLPLLFQLQLRCPSLVSDLRHLLLLLLENLLLLLDLLSERNSVLIKPLLLALLVDLRVPCQLDLTTQVLNRLYEVYDLLLRRLSTLGQLVVFLTGLLTALLMLFSDLALLLILLFKEFKCLLIGELDILECLQLQCRYLVPQLLYFLPLLLLLVSLILNLLVGLADLGLEAADPLDLTGCHPNGGPDRGGLLEYLIVSLLALLDVEKFLLVGALERLVNVLVLLTEGLEVLVAHDLLQEDLELPLDLLELVRLHAHRLDLLLKLDFVLNRIVIDVAVLTFTTRA
jgi:hypothetical protein